MKESCLVISDARVEYNINNRGRGTVGVVEQGNLETTQLFGLTPLLE